MSSGFDYVFHGAVYIMGFELSRLTNAFQTCS